MSHKEEDYLAAQNNAVGVGSKPTRDNGQVTNLPLHGKITRRTYFSGGLSFPGALAVSHKQPYSFTVVNDHLAQGNCRRVEVAIAPQQVGKGEAGDDVADAEIVGLPDVKQEERARGQQKKQPIRQPQNLGAQNKDESRGGECNGRKGFFEKIRDREVAGEPGSHPPRHEHHKVRLVVHVDHSYALDVLERRMEAVDGPDHREGNGAHVEQGWQAGESGWQVEARLGYAGVAVLVFLAAAAGTELVWWGLPGCAPSAGCDQQNGAAREDYQRRELGTEQQTEGDATEDERV